MEEAAQNRRKGTQYGRSLVQRVLNQKVNQNSKSYKHYLDIGY